MGTVTMTLWIRLDCHEGSQQVSTTACEWLDYFTHILAWEKAKVTLSGILEYWKYTL